jgi:alpha-amylase
MKNSFKAFLLSFLLIILGLTRCNDESVKPQEGQRPASMLKAGNTQGVIMQAFYWNVPMGGTWWGNIQSKTSSWASAGITALWLPPNNKCDSGPYSCGYDPYDYFDFGDYDQKGTVETRYGSKTELVSCITAAHNAGLKVYADIVMNHNGGGVSENNPNTGGSTNTKFETASGIFPRHYNDFHPSTYEASDAGTFGSYPDLCHKNPYVAAGLWGNSNSVAKYYKNTLKYDGWRFDWVNGYPPTYVNNFVAAASGFAVTEYWGTVNEIQSCISQSGVSSFDFPCMYAMQDAFTGNNLAALRDHEMLCRTNPGKAVTFVTNHDVNNITSNKLLAYAFILTHEGTPCIFYTDYESELDKAKLNTLISINKTLAAGTTTVLYADNDEYIAKMNGSPGLVVYINTSGSSQSRSVTTNWFNSNIKDFTSNVAANLTTNASGAVTISAPSNGYSVWSLGGTGGGATNATITLRMLKDVLNGNSLFFTGNNAALTNWSTGVQGSWNSGNYWTCTVTVPAGQQLEWKVRKGTTGGSGDIWESGSNHIIGSPVNGTTYTATFNGGF